MIFVKFGESILLNCTGDAFPKATAKWKRPFSSKFEAIGSPLVISKISSTNVGDYICQLENGVEPKVQRTVHVHSQANDKPTVLKPSIKQVTITEGDNITLLCKCKQCLDGSEEILWYRDTPQKIAETNPIMNIDTDDVKNVISYPWELMNVSLKDSGKYTCHFANGFGEDKYSIKLNVKKSLNIGNVKSGSHLKCISNSDVNMIEVLEHQNTGTQLFSSVYDCTSTDAKDSDISVLLLGKCVYIC